MSELTFDGIVDKIVASPDFAPELLNAAVGLYDENNPAGLLRLLRSNDLGVVSHGLYIFSEVGARGASTFDCVLQYVQSTEPGWDLYIAQGLIEHALDLSSPQMSRCLSLVDSGDVRVQAAMALVLSKVRPAALTEAIALSSQIDTAKHKNSARFLTSASSTDDALKAVISHEKISACYAAARLLSAVLTQQECSDLERAAHQSEFAALVWGSKRSLDRYGT